MFVFLFLHFLSIASGVVDVSLGFGGRVVRDIAGGVMDVGLSNWVDESGVEGVVDNWGVGICDVGSGVRQGIPRGGQGSVWESVDEGGDGSGVVGGAGKGHRGEGKQSEALHDDCQA